MEDKKRVSYLTYVIVFFIVVFSTIILFNLFFEDRLVEVSGLSNLELSDQIQYEILDLKEKYHINILYSEKDNIDTFAKKFNSTVQQNESVILENLKVIDEALSKYKKDLFKNKKLDIVLFDRFNSNTIALASRNKNNEYKIYISNDAKFERALHHELYHIFEYMKEIKILANWKNFNPDGFEYEQDTDYLTTQYVYDLDKNNPSYFVTKYSKTSEKEDRAEIFAEIMTFEKKPTYFETDQKIYNKAKYILSLIDEVKEKRL